MTHFKLTPLKPHWVEAIQFEVTSRTQRKYGVSIETNSMDVARFCGRIMRVATIPNGTPSGILVAKIPTPDGYLDAYLGDFIVKDSEGNLGVMTEDNLTSLYNLNQIKA